MANYEMTNSFDEKIMNWDRKDFDELVASFSEDEIQNMIDVLDDWDSFDICSDYWEGCYTDTEGRNCDVVASYIKRWFYSQIEEGIVYGTRDMFEIVMAIMG